MSFRPTGTRDQAGRRASYSLYRRCKPSYLTGAKGLFGNEWGVGDLPGGSESTRSEEGSSIIGCLSITFETGGPLVVTDPCAHVREAGRPRRR